MFTNQRRFYGAAGLALILLSACGCGGKKNGEGETSQGDDKTIVIVSSLPRTGSSKAQSDTLVNGIKMALEEVDYKVGDFTIVYQDLDDATAAKGAWAAEAEENNAKKAVADPNVMAYIGPFNSGAAKISMPILNKADLMMISPSNTAPELTKPDFGDQNEPGIYRPSSRVNYMRVVPTDDKQGELGAVWAKEMGVQKVYILDDGEVYGRGVANMFKEGCSRLGIDVIDHESIDPKVQEFRSLMTKIQATKPDLIYFGGTTQSKGGQIAKDMVAANIDAKLMVPDGCYEEAFILSAGPENVNGRAFITFGGIPPEEQTGKGKTFVEAYQKKYGTMPEGYAVYGYECAKVVLQAIVAAGKKDRRAITDAALATKDYDGALGMWSFDENGDTDLKKMSGNTVEDGKFKFVKLLSE